LSGAGAEVAIEETADLTASPSTSTAGRSVPSARINASTISRSQGKRGLRLQATP
jgi:hypothetical protein